jgi:hypothetical protein
MVNDVESNPTMKTDCNFVSAPQPEQVVKPKAFVSPARIPRVEPSRHGDPMKLQISILVVCEKSLNSVPVVRMRQNVNLMPPRKVQSPTPGKAGFRTLARAASVTSKQYFHNFHRLP